MREGLDARYICANEHFFHCLREMEMRDGLESSPEASSGARRSQSPGEARRFSFLTDY